MLHDNETTLNAYRELYPYTVESTELAVKDIKLRIRNEEDEKVKKYLLERLEVLETSLYIICNDD